MRSPIGVALLTIWVACGGGGKGGGGGFASIALEDQVEAVCTPAHTCRDSFPQDQGLDFEDLFGTTQPACVANLGANTRADEIQASVDAGRITFNAGAAAACLAFVDGLSCADFWDSVLTGNPPQPAACETTFIGTVPLGGMCVISDDCAGQTAFCNSMTCTDGGEG